MLMQKLSAALKLKPSTLWWALALLLVWGGAAQFRDFFRGFFDGLLQ
jgi:hypothetical protein